VVSFYSGCNVENAAYPEGLVLKAVRLRLWFLMAKRKIKDYLMWIWSWRAFGQPCGGPAVRRSVNFLLLIPDSYLLVAQGVAKPLKWKHCYVSFGLKP